MLDVIADERLIANAGRVGGRLRALLKPFGDARGRGLLIGVELSDAASAEQIVDALRVDGILIGRTGRDGNVLKIRPPLVFGDAHADLLVRGLERAFS